MSGDIEIILPPMKRKKTSNVKRRHREELDMSDKYYDEILGMVESYEDSTDDDDDSHMTNGNFETDDSSEDEIEVVTRLPKPKKKKKSTVREEKGTDMLEVTAGQHSDIQQPTSSSRMHDVPASAIFGLDNGNTLNKNANQKEIDIEEQIKNIMSNNIRDKPGSSKWSLLFEDDSYDDDDDDEEEDDDTRADNYSEASTSNATNRVRRIVRKIGKVWHLNIMPLPISEPFGLSPKPSYPLSDVYISDCNKRLLLLNIRHPEAMANRRAFIKERNSLHFKVLPKDLELVPIAVYSPKQNRDWAMDLEGSSYIAVLNRIVSYVLRESYSYRYSMSDDPMIRHKAILSIGDIIYGEGQGPCRYVAKSLAACASLNVLMPEIEMGHDAQPGQDPDFHVIIKFFECIGIVDPRVAGYSDAMGVHSPYDLLIVFLDKHFSGESEISTQISWLKCEKVELKMKVREHKAYTVCDNMNEAKQRASQSILQAFHPHVRSWGAIIRMYGWPAENSSD